MIIYRGKLKSFENKTCTSAGFSTTKSAGTGLGLTAGLHIMNLAVDCLCNEEPVCFVCKWKANVYGTSFRCSEQILNRTNYSARKPTHVKFEFLDHYAVCCHAECYD